MTVWDDLVGQAEACALFQRAAISSVTEKVISIEADSTSSSDHAMTHAWLITGPPGSGRSVAARAFAAALQCDNVEWIKQQIKTGLNTTEKLSAKIDQVSGVPSLSIEQLVTQVGCGQCQACVSVMEGSHPDVTVVATDKVTIPIEEVRQLVITAQRAPLAGRWRIIIVEDTDRMQERATNVLLKAVEEPPPHTVWLLCAPGAMDVLPTIRSRCRLVNLRIPPAAEVAKLLVERNGIDPEIASQCAAEAQCHIGVANFLATHPQARKERHQALKQIVEIRSVIDAVVVCEQLVGEVKDQVESYCIERNAQEKAQLMAALGVEEGKTLPPALRAQFRELEESQKRRQIRRVHDQLDLLINSLVGLLRDALVLVNQAEVPLINQALNGLAQELAHRFNSQQLIERIEDVETARRRLNSNVNPLSVLEALAVKMCPLTQQYAD